MKPSPPDLRIAALATTWGTVRLVADQRGIRECHLPAVGDRMPGRAFRVVARRLPSGSPPSLRRALGYAQAVLEGRRPGRCPPLHPAVWAEAPPFHRAVWRELRQIPRGRVLTYGEVARRAGRPRAARAVGAACGANPLPLFLPCHRVVAAGGAPGGFSSGRAWKLWLLAQEGARR